MRIAIFHNRYVNRGGEDRVVEVEAELLRKAGHEVRLFVVDNRDEFADSRLETVRVGLRARWNPRSYARVREFLGREPVDVGHVHNFFPVLSPAVHTAIRDRGLPVVQTLHNYRLVCANGLLQRGGRPCEECLERGPWNAVRYGCYRGSRLQTAVWSEQAAWHRRRGTWETAVDLFATPSEFAREKLLSAGIPPDRIVVKPNPVEDPGEPAPVGRGGVFLGRLSPEKGVHHLLEAWRQLGDVPLAIAGTGPEGESLRRRAAGMRGVRFLGEIDREGVHAALRAAAFVVAPSIAYETFGLSVAEAMASGRPAVAPRRSAPAELIDHGRTGLHFEPGDVASLAAACRELAESPALASAMGREARLAYAERLTPEAGLAALECLYELAVSARDRRSAGA